MPRELKNAQITHVSYVDKGANQKQFFFTKSADSKAPTFQKEVKVFINKEEAQKLVYGVVYEPDIEDSHDDFMTALEIEKAAHGFMKDARNIDTQHDFESGVGEVVESYIAPAEFVIGDQEIKKGSWVLVTKATDEIWEQIQKGDITGYSMAGTAETIEKQNEKPTPQVSSEESGLFNLLKNFFTGEKIQKGELRDRYDRNQKRRNLWAIWDGLETTYHESIWDNRTPDVADFERLETAAKEFIEIIQEIKDSGDIQKALGPKPSENNKEDDEMKAEDIQKAVTEALAPLNQRLEALEKENGEPEKNPEQTPDVAAEIQKAITASLEPVTQRLNAIEKARGISKQANPDDMESRQMVSKGYLSHFE